MSRKLARETAFRTLFQLEFNHGEDGEFKDYETLAVDFANETMLEEEKRFNRRHFAYIETVVNGVNEHLAEIDEMITKHLKKGWSLSRMCSEDRVILRLAVYELKFAEDKVPVGAIINEAVALAKAYGTDDSGKFVNGILSAISK